MKATAHAHSPSLRGIISWMIFPPSQAPPLLRRGRKQPPRCCPHLVTWSGSTIPTVSQCRPSPLGSRGCGEKVQDTKGASCCCAHSVSDDRHRTLMIYLVCYTSSFTSFVIRITFHFLLILLIILPLMINLALFISSFTTSQARKILPSSLRF